MGLQLSTNPLARPLIFTASLVSYRQELLQALSLPPFLQIDAYPCPRLPVVHHSHTVLNPVACSNIVPKHQASILCFLCATHVCPRLVLYTSTSLFGLLVYLQLLRNGFTFRFLGISPGYLTQHRMDIVDSWRIS